MNSSDIILRLINKLPSLTNLFSDSILIDTYSNISGLATITTIDPHGLQVNSRIHITDTVSPIIISSIIRTAKVAEITAASEHDLTYTKGQTITIADCPDAIFNGTFEVIAVPNRFKLQISVLDFGAVISGGGVLLGANRYDETLNGLWQVSSIINDKTFTISSLIAKQFIYIGGKLKTNIRVSGTASIDRAIAAYTKQGVDKSFLFVVLGSIDASKSRNTGNDAIYQAGRSEFYSQTVIQKISLYVISDVKDEIGGRKIRDEMDDLLVAITKSILSVRFPVATKVGKANPLNFIGSEIYSYDGAVYVHQFIFEASFDLLFEDTSGYDPDVAFRNIDMSQYDFDPTSTADAFIKLDE